jgi:peptide/nickel transport system permease protein
MSVFTGQSERKASLANTVSDDLAEEWVSADGQIVSTPRSDRLHNLGASILKWTIIGAVLAGVVYLVWHISPGAHPFGQDNLGRDGFARVMRGTQTSLTVMAIIGLSSTLIGVILGSISGYFRGHTDNIIMRFTDMVITIPTIVIGAILGVLVGGGNAPVIFTAVPRPILLAMFLSFVTWTSMARLVRANFLALREQEFVDAARVAGSSHLRIMFRHILPNAVGVIIVNATLLMASAILLETGLSYLGFGIRAPEVSLGQIINEYQAAFATRPWLFWWPGLFIVAIALCVNFIGDGLRDAFDPRQRRIPTAKALARADAKKLADAAKKAKAKIVKSA